MNNQDAELSREELLQRYGKKSPDVPGEATRRSPFKFLDSYDAGDADIFFGRDFEIEELLRHFHTYGHVLIYGESGSGKTSLVQCGLRSQIPAADALFIPLRVHASGLSTVCHQIRESASLGLGEPVEISPQSGLVDTLREVRQAASRPVVLFFDQFEELFIFHDADTRRRFADDLASLRQAKLNVKVIIGVRQDYLAHLSELEDTVEGLFDNRFWLRRMSRENAAGAVVQACQTCDVGIDDEVAKSVLQRLDPSGQGIELPYLQVVMDRLYRQAVNTDSAHPVITAQDVQQLGDIANILGSFLVEEVAKLPSPDAGRQILKAFVTREGTRRTLDRVSVAQEAAGFGAAHAPADLDAHLSQLARVRILREIAETDSYELRHDALAATVAGWISEVEKELIEVRDNLVNRFKEYEARGGQQAALLDQGFLDYLSVYQQRLRPLLNNTLRQYVEESQRHVQAAQRLRRRARQLITGVVGSIIMVCLAIAVWQWMIALDARDEAQTQREEAYDRLELAKKAVDKMLIEVGAETLKDVPQMEGVRAALLEEALLLYEDIGETSDADDPETRFETAMANFQVGDIQRLLGSGTAPQKSEAAYKAAISQLAALSHEFPSDSRYQQELARSHMWLAESLREFAKDERAEETEDHYSDAIRIQEKLATDAAADYRIQYQLDLGRSLMNRGINRDVNMSRPTDAQKDYESAIELFVKSLREEITSAQDEECRVLLAKCHNNLGMLLRKLHPDNPELAKMAYRNAIDELAAVIETRRQSNQPVRQEYSLDLARFHTNLANHLQDLDEAVLAVNSAKELNVGIREVRVELARFLMNKGTILYKTERDQAISDWNDAAGLLEGVLRQNAQDAEARELLASTLYNIFWTCQDEGKDRVAIRTIDRLADLPCEKGTIRFFQMSADNMTTRRDALQTQSPELADEYEQRITLFREKLPHEAEQAENNQ